MSTVAIICQTEELSEAAQHFVQFEGLDVEIKRIESIAGLHGIPELLGLIVQLEGSAETAIECVRTIRESENLTFLPIVVVIPQLNNYWKFVCLDLEYTLPCADPPLSNELLGGIKKIVWLSRKRAPLLELRTQIERSLRTKTVAVIPALIEKFAAMEKDPFRIQLLQTRLLFESRDLKAAIEAGIAAVKENNKSLDARATLAQIYLEAGNLEKAQEVIDKSLAMAPQYPIFICLEGRIALLSGRMDEAGGKFKASLGFDRRMGMSLAGLISVEALLDHPVEKKVKAAGPGIARQLQVFAIDLARFGQFAEAEKLLQQSLKQIPQQKDVYKVWMNIGLQAKRHQQLKKALVFFKASAAAAPAEYSKAKASVQEIEDILMKKKGAA